VEIVDTTDRSFVSSSPGADGSGGKETWTFKGIKAGRDSIMLEHCQHWVPESTVETKVFVVTVK